MPDIHHSAEEAGDWFVETTCIGTLCYMNNKQAGKLHDYLCREIDNKQDVSSFDSEICRRTKM